MIEIHIAYQGQLRCHATHLPSQCSLHTDAPVDNHGRGESFSPTDLVATALATCLATILGIVADRKGVDLSGTTLSVQKHMSDSPPRRIARLPVEITIPLPPSHPDRPALEAAALACPVNQSLHPDIDRPISFHWVG